MREPISLKEVLAVVIKRGWGILIAAVAVAVVLGGLQFKKQMDYANAPENSAQQIEAEYQVALAEYEQQLAFLQESLEENSLLLERQKTYNDTSLLMQMDPFNAPKSIVVLSISGLDKDVLGTKDQSEDRYARMLSELQTAYENYWYASDLTKELQNSGMDGLEEKYIRELIHVSFGQGGSILIATQGETAASAEKLADAVTKCMNKIKGLVSESMYAHTLTELKSTTKLEVSEEILDHQAYYASEEVYYEEEVKNLTQQIEQLQAPQKRGAYSMTAVLKASIKWIILGFVVGGMLGCAWVLVLYLFRSRAESSRQMEQILGVPFLGSVAKKGDIFHRLADGMLMERVWKDPAQAQAYMTAAMKNAAEDAQRILILTTLNGQATEAALASVEKAAAAVSGNVSGLPDAERNPRTAEVLSGCRCVILAERVGVSDVPRMQSLLALAERMDAKVVGFVTI